MRSEWLHRNLVWALLLLTAMLMNGCQSSRDDLPTDVPTADDAAMQPYINLTIAVSTSDIYPSSRQETSGRLTAKQRLTVSPQGGENGDGRVAGFQRENEVTGITLILYQSAAGIAGDASTPISFIHYYPTTLVSRDAQGTAYAAKQDEAFYSTGDQRVDVGAIDFAKQYHAIVIANADLTTALAGKTLGEIRNYVLTADDLYRPAFSSVGNKPWTTGAFVMSTETDNVTIDFPALKTTVGSNVYYRVSDALRIERLAARIDFSTANATYSSDRHGYEYTAGTNDKFVVTRITPFNLLTANEYLLKRVQTTWAATPATTWLGDETTTNYVVDPQTADKDNTKALTYVSTVDDVHTNGQTAYSLAMDDVQGTEAVYAEDGKDQVIIAYPMENTLMPSSQLFRYATGLAIEGDYYTGGTGTPTKRVYYGYLRHQGESAGSYGARQWDDLYDAHTEAGHPATAMNFGIVRNNIYTVAIDHIGSSEGITLKIKVKKWDRYEHTTIYI